MTLNGNCLFALSLSKSVKEKMPDLSFLDLTKIHGKDPYVAGGISVFTFVGGQVYNEQYEKAAGLLCGLLLFRDRLMYGWIICVGDAAISAFEINDELAFGHKAHLYNNPFRSGFWSFVFPGLGQYNNKENEKALMHFGAAAGYCLIFGSKAFKMPMILPLLALSGYSMKDAYENAIIYNDRVDRKLNITLAPGPDNSLNIGF